MKILIFGGSGMLGHQLWINFQKEHDVWVTLRGNRNNFPDVSEFPKDRVRLNVDALYFDQVSRALAAIQPDMVINCIGLIKQHGHLAEDPIFSISLNAMFPHKLSLQCRIANIKLIHVSTDCVFSGNKGNYTEEDHADANDIYGRTKFLGEVKYPHCITLRTSIIGRELQNNLGLVEWFLAQEGKIDGFTKAIFSGLTTNELANVIMNYVVPNNSLSGLYHVSSDPISKYELLNLIKEVYGKDIKINPYDSYQIDRSLDSMKFQKATGYMPRSWKHLIEDMHKYNSLYEKIKK